MHRRIVCWYVYVRCGVNVCALTLGYGNVPYIVRRSTEYMGFSFFTYISLVFALWY